MVSPAWFFSTLAQATAAIIGFVIAFGAVLHQLERRHRERRTQELREELLDLKEEFLQRGGNISAMLQPFVTGDNFETVVEEVKTNNPDLKYPILAEMWYHTGRINVIAGNIDSAPKPQDDFLLTLDEFDELKERANRLDEILSDEQNELDQVCSEIESKYDINNDNTFLADVFGSLPDDSEHLPHNIAIREDLHTKRLREDLEQQYEGTPLLESGDLTGRNLSSLSYWVRDLKDAIRRADAKKGNTILDYEPNIVSIIYAVGGLMAVGVFGPIAFLFTLPNQSIILEGLLLFIIQFVLLAATSFFSVFLLWRLLNQIEYGE